MSKFSVRVVPRSSRNLVQLVGKGELKVWVTAAPVDGEANEAIVALVAKTLGLARRHVFLVSGHTSKTKVIEIEGLSEAEVEAKLPQPRLDL